MLVWEFLAESAAERPDKTAVVCGERRVTFAELDSMSDRLARALIDGGMRPGDRVAILLENSIEAAVAIFGTLKAGCVFLVLSQTIKTDKLEFVLNDCEARSVVTEPVFLDMAMDAGKASDSIELILCCGDPTIIESSDPPVVWFVDSDSADIIDLDVVSIDEKVPKGQYPKVTERVGESPPQYADEDA